MPEVQLIVNGSAYGGWKAVRVTRTIEALANSFDMDVSDRWSGQEEDWPILEEDECRVDLDGETVITGYVDRPRLAISAQSRALGYAGRDRAGALEDCSAVLDRWEFRDSNVYEIARAVAHPFGVAVWVQAGLVLPPRIRKLAVSPGDTAGSVIEKAAKMSGVLVVSDGAGGIVITQAGATRAEPLVQGQNILSASVEYDASTRFRRYVVATQIPGTDNTSADSTRIRAEAIDEGVRRTERVTMVLPDTGISTEYARRRADWEARSRAARAEAVSVTVPGWQQTDGTLWPVNAHTFVQAPAIRVNGDMLIATAEHVIDGGGPATTFRLLRPDAFTPEPQARVKASGGSWKELTRGV